MRMFSLIVSLLALAGCRPVDILNTLTPNTGYRLQQGIAFGTLPRQQLDIYLPVAPRTQSPRMQSPRTQSRRTQSPRGGPTPVIVFFYGGSWNSGARGDYRFVGQLLASEGYTVVIPDYRLYPQVTFPRFLEDGALALRWTQDHIAEYGGDSQRLFLMGHSAGAYNAIMLALDRRYGAAVGFDFARVKGVVGLAGPYDFELDSDLLKGVFGDADYTRTQPVTFAKAGEPPVLLAFGDADKTVNPANSKSLARHLRAAGSPVRLREYPGLDHIDLVLQLSAFRYKQSAVRDAILDFLADPRGD